MTWQQAMKWVPVLNRLGIKPRIVGQKNINDVWTYTIHTHFTACRQVTGH